MVDKTAIFGAPIPGANYTSDTKNYPWHRPPEITSLDEAIEVSFKKLTDEENSQGFLTLMEMGFPISSLTSAFVISGIGAGKWTPDFAILLAGPVSHILYLMGKGYGLDPEMGVSKKSTKPSPNFFKALGKSRESLEELIEGVDLDDLSKNAGEMPPMGGMVAMAGGLGVDAVGGESPDPMGSVEQAENLGPPSEMPQEGII